MDELQSAALITELTDRLHENDSWCGETHLQKAMYFMQELVRVPMGFDFILYKYGPFSFGFRDKLTAMCADRLLALTPQPPYGPSFVLTELGREFRARFPKTLAQYGKDVQFVAEKLGSKGVEELERLATALYVSLDRPGASHREQARYVRELKPHVTADEAVEALEELAAITDELGRAGLPH